MLRLDQQKSKPAMSGYEQMTLMVYAEDMSVGDHRSGLLCPYCHGGGSGERSMSMKGYVDGVAWKCWRNSCGKSGRLNVKTGFLSTDNEKDKSNVVELPWVKLYETQPITNDWETELLKYGILKQQAHMKGWQCNFLGNLVIPLKRPTGPSVVGHEFRNKDGRQPKSRINLTSKSDFPRNAIETAKGKRDVVLIVEDSLSALKASVVCRTYSLQGTNFTQRHAEELADEWKAKTYMLALDRDATRKAGDLLQRYRFILPTMKLCPINRDIKHFRVAEIEELVKTYE